MPNRITWRESDGYQAKEPSFIGIVGGIAIFYVYYQRTLKKWIATVKLGDFEIRNDRQDTSERAKTACERALVRFVTTIGAEFTTPAVTWREGVEDRAWDGYIGDDCVFTIRRIGPYSSEVGLHSTVKKYGSYERCKDVAEAKRVAAKRLQDSK
jgi:hypothetical protein